MKRQAVFVAAVLQGGPSPTSFGILRLKDFSKRLFTRVSDEKGHHTGIQRTASALVVAQRAGRGGTNAAVWNG